MGKPLWWDLIQREDGRTEAIGYEDWEQWASAVYPRCRMLAGHDPDDPLSPFLWETGLDGDRARLLFAAHGVVLEWIDPD